MKTEPCRWSALGDFDNGAEGYQKMRGDRVSPWKTPRWIEKVLVFHSLVAMKPVSSEYRLVV